MEVIVGTAGMMGVVIGVVDTVAIAEEGMAVATVVVAGGNESEFLIKLGTGLGSVPTCLMP